MTASATMWWRDKFCLLWMLISPRAYLIVRVGIPPSLCSWYELIFPKSSFRPSIDQMRQIVETYDIKNVDESIECRAVQMEMCESGCKIGNFDLSNWAVNPP